MEDNIETKLKYLKETLLIKDNVLGVIYQITNKNNNKKYIGQTVSHKLNSNKYKPFNFEGRFRQHCSDAINNTKKKQCMYLNNAIRKNGTDAFSIELIEYCLLADANNREIAIIKERGTLFPNGYNLTEGGNKGPTLTEQKIKLMEKTQEQFYEKKLAKYKNINTKIDINNLDQYISECNYERFGGKYFILKIDNIKSIFVAQHLPLAELKNQVYEFLKKIALMSAT